MTRLGDCLVMITEGGGDVGRVLQPPHHQQSRKQVWQNKRILMRLRSRFSAYIAEIAEIADEWSFEWDKWSIVLSCNEQNLTVHNQN